MQPDRNYRDEMNQHVELMWQREPGGDAYALALRLLEELKTSDPDLIEGWLHAQALVFLAQVFLERPLSRPA